VVLLSACARNPSPSKPPSSTPVEARIAAQTLVPAPGKASSFRWVSPTERPKAALPASPVSLTATDGTGLRLKALEARAVVEDPLSFTELHMVFENPQDRVIEGHFRCTLPEGASVSRFAMRLEGKWQEGEVVELMAARRAYEDFLHRRQDPALLEQGAGNEFQARVFPIPPRGVKEIVLSYSQERASLREPFRLPLRGLPELGRLDIRVLVVGAGVPELVEEHRTHYVPPSDFEVPADKLPARVGVRSGTQVVARVTPELSSEPDEIASLLLLVDTSASRALGFEEQVRLVEGLVTGLEAGAGSEVPLLVAAFDQDVELVYQGTAGGWGERELDKLRDRLALGASNLTGALRWAAQQQGYARVLVVTDGVATAGDTDAGKLREAVLALGDAHVERMDVVAVGGIRDSALLRTLVTAGLARDGAVVDGHKGVEGIASALTRKTRSGIQVTVEGAEWSWPRVLDGVQSGDSVLVYAEVPLSSPVRIALDGVAVPTTEAEFGAVEVPLLERAAVKANIAALTEQRDETGDAHAQASLKDAIVALSTTYRVLSPFTGLLVLETEADYARFRINRQALADVLTVGESGLAVLHRTSPVVPERQEMAREEGKMGKSDSTRQVGEPARAPLPASDVDRAQTRQPPQAPSEAGMGMFDKSDALYQGYGSGTASGGTTSGQVASQGRVASPPAPPPRATSPRAGIVAPDDIVEVVPPSRSVAPRSAVVVPETNPYTGTFLAVMTLLGRKKLDDALARARAWRAENPGDVMALVALGEVFEKRGELGSAARAYGSLVDLFPARADLRRFAGERLERIALPIARELAADTYAKAAEQRPDHPASHRLHAFALLRLGLHEAAFTALEAGLSRSYPDDRFAGARQILAEDLGLLAAAWTHAEPKRSGEIRQRLRRAGGRPETAPSMRFVLTWETDANDVDFHIYDGQGQHAFYSQTSLASGGELYADVTTGYGPECFTIRGNPRAYPYRLQAHYYSRGPMGYGMGKLEIIRHDGQGGLHFEERPFVVMQDQAYVDLGTVRRAPTASLAAREVRR
jgi:hypothetical protein